MIDDIIIVSIVSSWIFTIQMYKQNKKILSVDNWTRSSISSL